MGCGRKRPTYSSKKSARKHGHIQYGEGKFQVYAVKKGYRVRKT